CLLAGGGRKGATPKAGRRGRRRKTKWAAPGRSRRRPGARSGTRSTGWGPSRWSPPDRRPSGRPGRPVTTGNLPMTNLLRPDSPDRGAGLYRLYRNFFDRAEKTRCWSLADDVPWDQCNPAMAPSVADVAEEAQKPREKKCEVSPRRGPAHAYHRPP